MPEPIKNAIETVADTINQITGLNEHKKEQVTPPEAANMNVPAFAKPGEVTLKESHSAKVMRHRFLRMFDKVDVCDAVNFDTSGEGKQPDTHLHVRFHLPEEVAEKLSTYEKIGYLSQEINTGKAILSQYGITDHEDAPIEKVHRDPATGKVTNAWIQFDCDFGQQPERRSDMMRSIEADLQRGIEEAKASRGAALGIA